MHYKHMHVHNTYFITTSEYLSLALLLGTGAKFVKHLVHSLSIRGLFKALYRTTYEIQGLLVLRFKQQ